MNGELTSLNSVAFYCDYGEYLSFKKMFFEREENNRKYNTDIFFFLP